MSVRDEADNFVFNQKEFAIVKRVISILERQKSSVIKESLKNLYTTYNNLKLLAEFLLNSPPISSNKKECFFGRERSRSSLEHTLYSVYNYNIELYLPIKVLIGKDFLLAKVNFFKSLIYSLEYIIKDSDERDEIKSLILAVRSLIANSIYSRLSEELFLSIVIDRNIERSIKSVVINSLLNIWDKRVQYGIHDFAPFLESLWKAKESYKLEYGSMLGFSEVFSFFMNNIDKRFLNFFLREDISKEEEEAFLEFVFDLSIEEIKRLQKYIYDENVGGISYKDVEKLIGRKQSEMPLNEEEGKKIFMIFENYRRRKLQATYRIIAGADGPRKTLEEYLMVYLIREELKKPNKKYDEILL
jgi:hypothetical protein